MKINEIFYSLQMEGNYLGKPSLFIRLQGCNLMCRRCDTKYALTGEYKEMDITQILEEINKYPQCHHITITGGEPLLQKEELTKLISHLAYIYQIEIETNGTISPSPELNNLAIHFNISLKGPWSRQSERKTVKPKIIKDFLISGNNSTFKFVYKSIKDEQWMERIISDNHLSTSSITIMPEGRTPQEVRSKEHKIIEYCKQKGYRFSPRYQILVWGQKKGV